MSEAPATVVLLHGLARTHRSVAKLRRFLEEAGYATWSETYPSRRGTLAELARDVAERVLKATPSGELHAVTHSLGGVLIRHMPMLPWRRVVMLAPPNRGSRVARALAHHPLYRWFYGPAGQEVSGGSDWPPVRSDGGAVDVGVIAGTAARTVGNPIGWVTRGLGLLPATVPSDGTVAVDETRLDQMADFTTVDASHTWIMNHPRARELVVRFFERGRFE